MTDRELRLRQRIDTLSDGLEIAVRDLERKAHQVQRLTVALRNSDRKLRAKHDQYVMWRDRARDAEAQMVGKISERRRGKKVA